MRAGRCLVIQVGVFQSEFTDSGSAQQLSGISILWFDCNCSVVPLPGRSVISDTSVESESFIVVVVCSGWVVWWLLLVVAGVFVFVGFLLRWLFLLLFFFLWFARHYSQMTFSARHFAETTILCHADVTSLDIAGA